MKILTEDAVLKCAHETGTIPMSGSQDFVTIRGRKILVEPDPVGKSVLGCPNMGVGIKPCTSTLAVQVGYSDLLKISGKRVCLDTVKGLTDGTPPGTVEYTVAQPGQSLAEEVE
ncbi:hypothetical protein QA601_03340 [Chitinispirillales bacterium ANBcel5]|uniref:hypothetical protein n=1 Tax=Cellulosispirillum alkaliphilum TaxID=3039283 RepID=UPI002A52771A|nr:hypothetical protein [Chitinispirillales bacterium ANBcel5]